jgi:hypothetical protein
MPRPLQHPGPKPFRLVVCAEACEVRDKAIVERSKAVYVKDWMSFINKVAPGTHRTQKQERNQRRWRHTRANYALSSETPAETEFEQRRSSSTGHTTAHRSSQQRAQPQPAVYRGARHRTAPTSSASPAPTSAVLRSPRGRAGRQAPRATRGSGR